jgi:hypothetical protein
VNEARERQRLRAVGWRSATTWRSIRFPATSDHAGERMNRLMTIATDAGPWIEKMELSDTGGINDNLRAEAVEREGTGSISWLTSRLDAMCPTLYTPRGRYPSGLGWRRYDAEWAWRQ